MNLDYLGDALDHWKGSLFAYLQLEGALRNFAVDAMATDLVAWSEADFCIFARLLRINGDQIVQHKESLLRARHRYFSEITHGGDIFLDPDTGIATGGGNQIKHIEKYVRPTDLALLLRSNSGRVVAVYQHVRARRTCERVDACLAAIENEIDAFGWCSYESATVAILFLCEDDVRTREIESAFKKLLGSHAKRRVRAGPKVGHDR
ncbi:MAG: hypothetical protein Q8N47_26700 [Bryobacterales bacterium]|nr:hypothetical protein [Bryobacterales bacterium]